MALAGLLTHPCRPHLLRVLTPMVFIVDTIALSYTKGLLLLLSSKATETDSQQRVLSRILTGFPFESPRNNCSDFPLLEMGDTIASAKLYIFSQYPILFTKFQSLFLNFVDRLMPKSHLLHYFNIFSYFYSIYGYHNRHTYIRRPCFGKRG